jgi:hypothetical protein
MQELTTKSDQRGRICLGRKIIEKYGTEFIIIPMTKEIILLPLIQDPIKGLQEEGKKLPKLSIKQLRQEILKEAFKELE